jgi:hypothetical protein
MAMARGVMALTRQAEAWLDSYRQHLAAVGLGFTDDDLRVIAESHAAHPVPEGTDPAAGPSLGDQAAAMATAAKALAASYPEEGFAAEEPRIAPVAGVSLVQYAVAARAMGWDTDPALKARVLSALGIDPAAWDPAIAGWTPRLTSDMAVATFYGQLYANAEPLPRRAG